jgi:outer membrane biosynthesis protein TonB
MAASSAPRPGIQVGHGLDELEKTVPGPPPSTDPPPIGSDDRTVVDTAPGAPAAPALHLAILDDEEAHDDDEPWSLVERLVRPPEHAAGKHPVVEIVHYRGEHVVDHRVLREGERFLLGDTWTKAQRVDRGLTKPLPLVHLKKDGVAEILQHDGVTGRVLRQGVQTELPAGGAPAPLVDGELCSLKIGAERIFVRFAGVPALLWTPEQLQEARAERRLTALSGFFAVAFLAFLVGMSWLYGFRSKNEDVIELGDDGFAEVVIKDLEFKEPEPEKKKEPPPPVKAPEPTPTPPEPTSKTPPTPTPKEQPKAAPADAAPSEAPKTTGLAAALSNIPKVNDSASSQNLNAALSNIKGVRVPGAQGGFKTSALTGKGPSSGVQIGGAAGGVATSGINSLIRKDGAAGSLGGKGDRAVAGKVTTQPRRAVEGRDPARHQQPRRRDPVLLREAAARQRRARGPRRPRVDGDVLRVGERGEGRNVEPVVGGCHQLHDGPGEEVEVPEAARLGQRHRRLPVRVQHHLTRRVADGEAPGHSPRGWRGV